MWPVKGTSEAELWRNTGIFLHSTLSIPHDEMEEERISEIRRMRTGGNRIKDEALVVFIVTQKPAILSPDLQETLPTL